MRDGSSRRLARHSPAQLSDKLLIGYDHGWYVWAGGGIDSDAGRGGNLSEGCSSRMVAIREALQVLEGIPISEKDAVLHMIGNQAGEPIGHEQYRRRMSRDQVFETLEASPPVEMEDGRLFPFAEYIRYFIDLRVDEKVREYFGWR